MKLKSEAFGLLFIVTLTAGAGNMALQSVLPAIGREFGLADTLVAFAFALSALLWTLCSPYWARLSDRWGRKRVMMIGLAGFIASMLGFGIAATLGLVHWLSAPLAFVLMAIARAIYGLLGSAAPIAAQAYVADRTTRGARTRAMSMLASAQGLGTVIGPAVAPFFVLPFVGLAGPMYAFAFLGVVVLVLVWKRLPSGDVARHPVQPGDPAGKGLWKDPRVRAFLIYGLLATGAQAINIAVLGFHVIDEMGLPATEAQSFIGVAMLSGAAATLMVQWGLIPLLRMQPLALMRWGAAMGLVGNVMSIWAPDFFGVVVGYAVVSMGAGFSRPGFTAGSSLAVEPHEQGAIAGLMMSLAGLSFLAPPVIGVALYELAVPAPFIANSLILAAALFLAFTSPALRQGHARRGQAVQGPASQPGPEGRQNLG